MKCKPWIRDFQPRKFQCFSSQFALHGLRALEVRWGLGLRHSACWDRACLSPTPETWWTPRIFFFRSGRGMGEFEAPGRGGGRFLLKSPGRGGGISLARVGGGGGAEGREGVCGNFGGELNFFFRGRNALRPLKANHWKHIFSVHSGPL